MDQEDFIIELLDEHNQPVQFSYLMGLDYQDQRYVILQPVDDPQVNDDEVVIMHVEKEGEEYESFELLEDEELAQKVFACFLECYQADDQEE